MNDYVDHSLLVPLLSLAFKQKTMQPASFTCICRPDTFPESKKSRVPFQNQRTDIVTTIYEDLSRHLDQQFNSRNYGIISQLHIK